MPEGPETGDPYMLCCPWPIMPWSIKALPEQRRRPRDRRAQKAGCYRNTPQKTPKPVTFISPGAWLSVELLPGLPPPVLPDLPLPGSHGPATGDHAVMVLSGLIEAPAEG